MVISLKAKLSAGFVAVTVSGSLIAGVLVDRNVGRTTLASFEDRLSYETTMLGQMTASALFGDIDPTDTSLKDSVHALGAAVHTQLSVIAKDGTVVADSDTDDSRALGSQVDAPEIAAARATGKGSALRDGRMFVAAAIVRDGGTLGFARSSVPMSEVTAQLAALRARMAAGSALALLFAVVLGLLFSSALVRPIRALSRGARRVGAGDFEHVIDVSTSDEIGELARAFNDMTASLRATIAQLDGRNRDMRLVLDNVDQGLLTIDRTGAMSMERSAVVAKWFGPPSLGERFVDCLKRKDAAAAEMFEVQWEELLEGWLPRALLLHQLPKQFRAGDSTYQLSYIPIVEADDRLAKLLVVISDITSRLAAERAEAEQREVATMFERIMRDKSGVLDFLMDAEMLVRELTATSRPALVETKRKLHTLKGNAGVYGMLGVARLCHEIETRMSESQGDLSESDRNVLAETWTRTAARLSSFLDDKDLGVTIDDNEYAYILRSLLDGTPRGEVIRVVRDWKMERASERLERFAGQARDLAKRLQKGDVEVRVDGAGLRLPREEWSAFWASFTHVVRNAVDHGLESPEERRKAGKDSDGRIGLSAARIGRSVQIELSDDGRGIDWARVADRARRAGLACSSQDDLVAALFADGISTKDTVSDVSGRGVGLGAAKQACERLGGYVSVDTQANRGTTFRFHMPIPERGQSLRPPESVRPPHVSSATAG
ncbi:MAG: HAMP domain-containing protein [Polyangiaceae bacterium]|jgi:two-component system chemotaxis sensor kinase CheA